MPNYSLKNKLLTSVLIVILIMGALATLSVFYFSRSFFIQNQKDTLEIIVSEQAHETGRIFNQGEKLSESIALQPDIINYLANDPQSQNQEVLEQLEQYNIGNDYSAIYLLNSEGETLTSTDPAFVGNNYSFRDYFKEAIGGQPYVSAAVGVTSKQLGYYFSYPVIYQDQVIGVVVAKMKPEVINNSIRPESITGQSSTLLIDQCGVVIYSDDPDKIYKSIGELSVEKVSRIEENKSYENVIIEPLPYSIIQDNFCVDELFTGSAVFETESNGDRSEEIISVSQIEDLNFYIITIDQTNVISRQSFLLSIVLALFVVVAAGIASIIISYISGQVLQPLEDLRQATKKISSGDFSQRVVVRSQDEVGQVATDFNKMIDDIIKSRSNVDKRVAKQTAEIRQASQKLANQQKATLNVLEDIASEKELSDKNAQDLKKFQQAVASASDHIVITDPDGKILYANRAVEVITGFPRAEIIGQKVGNKENWGGQMDTDTYRKIWQIIKVEKKPFVGELINRRKNGQTYTVEAKISPILDSLGQIKFFVGIERDITREKELSKMKDEFLNIAAHDLRTPMTAIKGYLDMILEGDFGEVSDKLKVALTETKDANERLIRLVNEFLTLSRIERGKITVQVKDVDIIPIINLLAKQIRPIAEKKNLQLIVKPLPEKLMVQTDYDKVQQVIINLLDNAIKYTAQGTITLAVKQSSEEATISVTDTGPGIFSEQQEKLFSKYYQVSGGRQKVVEGKGAGLGLGLYVSRLIVEKCGGKIWVTSEPGRGSTFAFTLPLVKDNRKSDSKISYDRND